MKALIIFDSYFGNTDQVARAVGRGLEPQAQVEIRHVEAVKPAHIQGVDLLVIGSPTRAFKPTKALTDFLKSLPKGSLKGVCVAAFDTRISAKDIHSAVGRFFVGTFGYAADPIASLLKKKGGSLTLPPEGFIVMDSEGPLKEGELERAAEWVKSI